MRCECYRVGGPFIAEDPDCPIHGYEAQAREKEERAYRESEEEKQNELLARIIALEEKIDAMPQCTQPAPSVPEGWKPIPEKHPTFDLVDLRLADGSVLCGCVPQSDGDYWWEGPSGEVFIDPKYAPATHWRISAATEAKPCP